MDWVYGPQRPVGGYCERNNGPSGSLKCRGILDQLCDYQFLKKDSGPWSWK